MMNATPRKVLWADDEIDLLKPHILLLEEKGFLVTPVSNGDDAVACASREKFDAVLLDESMPGMDGLRTLEAIKERDPNVPVVLVTKNEAESLMDEAIGRRIDDFLLKPVLPQQIFLALKRLLESDRLQARVGRSLRPERSVGRGAGPGGRSGVEASAERPAARAERRVRRPRRAVLRAMGGGRGSTAALDRRRVALGGAPPA
jgi:DNA-binding NtrC family response regulator